MRRSHLQSHVTYRSRGHVTNQKPCISTFTRSTDPNLAVRCPRMKGTLSQCHMILRHRGHLKNKKRYIFTFMYVYGLDNNALLFQKNLCK